MGGEGSHPRAGLSLQGLSWNKRTTELRPVPGLHFCRFVLSEGRPFIKEPQMFTRQPRASVPAEVAAAVGGLPEERLCSLVWETLAERRLGRFVLTGGSRVGSTRDRQLSETRALTAGRQDVELRRSETEFPDRHLAVAKARPPLLSCADSGPGGGGWRMFAVVPAHGRARPRNEQVPWHQFP